MGKKRSCWFGKFFLETKCIHKKFINKLFFGPYICCCIFSLTFSKPLQDQTGYQALLLSTVKKHKRVDFSLSGPCMYMAVLQTFGVGKFYRRRPSKSFVCEEASSSAFEQLSIGASIRSLNQIRLSISLPKFPFLILLMQVIHLQHVHCTQYSIRLLNQRIISLCVAFN